MLLQLLAIICYTRKAAFSIIYLFYFFWWGYIKRPIAVQQLSVAARNKCLEPKIPCWKSQLSLTIYHLPKHRPSAGRIKTVVSEWLLCCNVVLSYLKKKKTVRQKTLATLSWHDIAGMSTGSQQSTYKTDSSCIRAGPMNQFECVFCF